MNNILAIDTSTEACSVALLFNGEMTHDFIISQRDHTKQILPMVDKLLKQSACQLSQIDAIAFGKGPGSFTGVRIGIGVAQGLAFGIDKPMLGVSTLKTLAQGAYRTTGAKIVVPAIDARMEEVYLGIYAQNEHNDWENLIPECVISPHDVAGKLLELSLEHHHVYFAGTGWQTYPNMAKNVQNSGCLLPNAQDMLVIAEKMLINGEIIKVEEVEATYLRNEVTWKKLPGK